MKGIVAFSKINNISDTLLADADIGVVTPLPRPKSKLSQFFGSSWGVALICGVVALSTLGAIIWAGNRPQTPPQPPIGTTQETEGLLPDGEETTQEMPTEAPTEALTNPENASIGLTFVSNGKGKCTVTGIGTCEDKVLVIPTLSPAGDIVTTIGENAFKYCAQIEEVVFPSTLTTIEAYAFLACDNLKKVTIPDGVHTIGDNAFCSCSQLMYVTFEGNIIRNMGQFVFSSTELIHIVLPQKQRSIPVGTFASCTSLESVTIPATVSTIGYAAFADCFRLNTIVYLGSQDSWNAITKENEWDYQAGEYSVQTDNSQTTSPVEGSQGLLYGEYNTQNNTCYVIGWGSCTDKDVVIPTQSPDGYTVKRIYSNAFAGTDIRSVTLHDGITAILSGAFKDCTSLEAVYNMENVTTIYSEAFAGCTSLQKFDFSARLKTIGEYAFQGSALKELNLANSGVKFIEEGAFENCEYLISALLPDECEVGRGVFSGCARLQTATLPKTLDVLQVELFRDCNCLQDVTMYSAVKEIEMLAFYGCYNLISIRFEGKLSQWKKVKLDEEWALGAFPYIKVACLSGGDVWYLHSGDSTPPVEQLVYESSGIGTCTVIDQGYLLETHLTIPATSPDGDKVTVIDGAFIHNTRLASVVIPEGVTEIGISSFYGCMGLTEVHIPGSVWEISMIAFKACESLTDIYYSGTKEEWENITFGRNWDEGMPSYTVHCRDGNIVVEK